MKQRNLTLLPLIAVLASTAAWSIGSQARALVQETEETDCQAVLRPEIVPAQDDDVLLAVVFEGDPGSVTDVRTEDGSGIDVLWFEGSEESLTSELTTRINLAEAVQGVWRMEFEGEGGVCSGQLTVSGPAAVGTE